MESVLHLRVICLRTIEGQKFNSNQEAGEEAVKLLRSKAFTMCEQPLPPLSLNKEFVIQAKAEFSSTLSSESNRQYNHNREGNYPKEDKRGIW